MSGIYYGHCQLLSEKRTYRIYLNLFRIYQASSPRWNLLWITNDRVWLDMSAPRKTGKKGFKFRSSGNTLSKYHILCKQMKMKFGKKCNYIYNFFRNWYVKSDLTQSGMLTVALLFFSVKLSTFTRVQRQGQRSKPFQKCDF